ncbi:alpha/beta fold hydrolase [Kribbella jejuensis]|uniref:alpha/beta fold hydrolase n=1 Tax=Kribbella jejuensis TaxID=236068 RepID=UPI003B515A59
MVPGGWQGAWVFDSVAEELRRRGHGVEAVTLAGLELEGPTEPERPANLEDHIEQVVEVVERTTGGPLALCGHSYAGMVIAGVADRVGDRLQELVFIDAYVPEDGDSCWSLTSDVFREMFIVGAGADGRWVGVPEGMDPRARAHPFASFVQSVRLEGRSWAWASAYVRQWWRLGGKPIHRVDRPVAKRPGLARDRDSGRPQHRSTRSAGPRRGT